jgi:hypothetical protein
VRRLDQPLIAEIPEVILQRTRFTVVQRLAEVRCADDAKASSFAQELLLLGAKFQPNDVAGGTHRTARVCRRNRTAALARHIAWLLYALALCLGTCPARIAGTFRGAMLQRLQAVKDGIVGRLAHDAAPAR